MKNYRGFEIIKENPNTYVTYKSKHEKIRYNNLSDLLLAIDNMLDLNLAPEKNNCINIFWQDQLNQTKNK